MKSKPISVIPAPETSEKIDRMAKALRTSRAGLCEVALEFVLPHLSSGKMAIVNGKLQFQDGKAAQPQAA